MGLRPNRRRQAFRTAIALTLLCAPGCASSRQLSHPSSWFTPGQAVPAPSESALKIPAQLVDESSPARPASPFQLISYNSQAGAAAGSQEKSAKIQEEGSPSDIVSSPKDNIVSQAAGSLAGQPLASFDAMTLVDFESLAFANNPTLQGLNATAQKAAGFRTQVSLRSNPIVGYQGVQLADQGTDQHTAFVQQEFVTGGKLELNRRVLNEAVRAQLLEVETQRFRIVTDIRAKFYQALAAQQTIELISEFRAITDKGLEIANLRKKAQEGSQIDVLQARVQKNEVDLAFQQAQFAYAAAWKSLAALAGTSYLAPTRLEGELPSQVESLDWPSVADNLLESSPERRAAQVRVGQARANLERQGVQAIPNLTVQFAAGVDNGTNSGMMNLQVGAPIPVFNKNEGNIAAARAEYCRALADVQRIENSIQARLASISQDFDSAAAAVAQYSQEILPSAKESLELAELAYKAGETSFLQVLVARRTFFDSNLQYVLAQSRLAQSRAQVDGFVLTGGLDAMNDQSGDDALRGLTFSQQ